MPYARSLQQYCLPEFFVQAPEEWTRRLAEVSPTMPNLDRLVFRLFDAGRETWNCSDRPQWVLYSAKDIRLVDKDRAAQFERHWSELPTEQQAGRQAVVSDYQHFMWHSQGLYVKPFLILQGPWGGTPAKYTPQEEAFLKGSHCFAEPFPIGSFPACPFDERAVKQITLRDRLLKASNSLDHLAKMDTAEGKKADEEAAEQIKRQTIMDTWREMIQPSLEFMQSFLRTKEADRVLPRAPEGFNNTVGSWREHWLEHGALPGVGPAAQRKVQMAVV